MSLPHFISTQAIYRSLEPLYVSEGFLPLEPRIVQHITTLRLKRGEHFTVVDAQGYGAELELLQPCGKGEKGVMVRLVTAIDPPQRNFQLTLVQGVSVAERMDQTIRQVTELGVARIIPYLAHRSTVRVSAAASESKADRWRRVALAAAEQSGAPSVPRVDAPCKLNDLIPKLKGFDNLICAWEEARTGSLSEAVHRKTPRSNHQIALIIGPEGGFDAGEVQAFEEAGAAIVTLGTTILRTETAAVVGSALTLYELGALGNV
jgi:16S rRNA (uracil1498-N3)-methyltransferase